MIRRSIRNTAAILKASCWLESWGTICAWIFSEGPMSDVGGYQKQGAEFDWPNVPRVGGGSTDLRVYNTSPVSAGFTTHMMDPHREHAYFVAFSPTSKMAFGYVWRRTDFPWLG